MFVSRVFFINTIAEIGTTLATGDWLHMASEIFIIRRNKIKHFLSKLNQDVAQGRTPASYTQQYFAQEKQSERLGTRLLSDIICSHIS